MKVSIIILNWNGGEVDCIEAIESAMAQSYANKELIFVDNGSSDGSGLTVQQRYPDITYISLEKNIGCPPGRNVGAHQAKGDLLFFLENDGVWDNPELISDAVDLFTKHQKLGAVYTRVEGYETGSIDSPLDPLPSKDTYNGLYLSSSFRGGASIIRTELFADCGGFPSDFFRQCEERFLSLLIYDRGYKVAYWPVYSLRHKGSDYVGKAAAVSSFNVENNLKTILRLYPFLPAITIGLSKWIVSMVGLFRAELSNKIVPITSSLIKELFVENRFRRVSNATFCLVETLRQGRASSTDIDSEASDTTLLSLIFSRLFLGK